MIVGVTGHRDVEQEPGELLAFARLSVEFMQARGVSKIITGMARGWDLKVARAAIDLKVPFIAAMPFPGQAERWALTDRQEWQFAVERAHDIATISPFELNVSYLKRDRWIVTQCDELWALDSGRPSGSHTTVLYAGEVNRTVRPLWEPWLRFRAERS